MEAQKKSKRKNSVNKPKFEKGKVYIPTFKMIAFCGCVIVVCVTLLLITVVKNKDVPEKSIKETQKTENTKKITEVQIKPPVSESAQQNVKKPEQIQQKKSNNAVTKKTEVQKPVELKKIESKDEKKVDGIKENLVKDNLVKENPVAPNSHVDSNQIKNQKTEQAPSVSETGKFNFPAAKNGAQLVFVFDDGGQNLNHLDGFLKLPFPITVAVLPRLAHSEETAKKVRQSENEVILHQPMQAINKNVNPGPGAITPEMSEDEIISTLFQNITEIGPISGVNNHEGSAITADAEKMAIIMKTVNEEGLYFLDSRTNVETKVPFVAKEMGYNYYERNIFLDNSKTRENALQEIKKGIDIANKNGVVIMIGHVWSANFLPQVLEEIYPELVEKGYTFKTISNSKAKK